MLEMISSLLVANPWIVPAVAGLLIGQIPILVNVVGKWVRGLTPEQRLMVVNATKGLHSVIHTIAPLTPTNVDDQIDEFFRQLQDELGPMAKRADVRTLAGNVLASIAVADPTPETAVVVAKIREKVKKKPGK